MTIRKYSEMELTGLAAMLTGMLGEREVFTKNYRDMGAAHAWLKDTLQVIAREQHLRQIAARNREAVERIRNAGKERGVRKNQPSYWQPLISELLKTDTWTHGVIQQRKGTKYGRMITLWVRIYERSGHSWARDIPNRFYFAEISPDLFQYVSHDYTL